MRLVQKSIWIFAIVATSLLYPVAVGAVGAAIGVASSAAIGVTGGAVIGVAGGAAVGTTGGVAVRVAGGIGGAAGGRAEDACVGTVFVG